MSFHIILIASIIILFASIVKGLTGFGLALIAIPLLSLLLPVKFLVPLITIINLITSFIIILNSEKVKFQKDETIIPIFGVIGITVGSLLLPTLSDIHLKKVLAVVLVIISFAFISGYRFKIRNIIRARITAGLASGLLGGLFSISGPPMVLFLTSLDLDKTRFRVSFSWYSMVITTVAVISFIYSGLLTGEVLLLSLYLTPALFGGTIIGNKLAGIFPGNAFKKACILVTLISGVMLFITSPGW